MLSTFVIPHYFLAIVDHNYVLCNQDLQDILDHLLTFSWNTLR